MIENGPSRAKSTVAIIGIRDGAAQNKRTDVERHPPADGRQVRLLEAVEKTPSPEGFGAERPHEMGRDRVAGERCLVHEQHLVTFAREQHGCGRTGTPRADHDDVEHVRSSRRTHRVEWCALPLNVNQPSGSGASAEIPNSRPDYEMGRTTQYKFRADRAGRRRQWRRRGWSRRAC